MTVSDLALTLAFELTLMLMLVFELMLELLLELLRDQPKLFEILFMTSKKLLLKSGPPFDFDQFTVTFPVW